MERGTKLLSRGPEVGTSPLTFRLSPPSMSLPSGIAGGPGEVISATDAFKSSLSVPVSERWSLDNLDCLLVTVDPRTELL